MSTTVTVSTELEAGADAVFEAVCTVDAFALVTTGLLSYRPIRHLHGAMTEGDELHGWLLLGGVLPFSRHRIRVERLDPSGRTLLTDERGGAIRRWRHRITVEPLGEGRCRYTDEIEIDAGPLTAAVGAFAEGFYRVRQRRWRRLAHVIAAVATEREELAGG